MKLSAATKPVCVIGYPVSHSLSPMLHNAWIEKEGLEAAYLALSVAPGTLPKAFDGLRTLGFLGANITVPHKEEALHCVDELDATARRLGAVNTLQIQDGKLIGYNTDAEGFIAHLKASEPKWRMLLETGDVLVLGAGGAARAVVYGLLEAGAKRVLITNRTTARADALAVSFKGQGAVDVADWADRENRLDRARLIVNTTPLGMTGQPRLDFDFSAAVAGSVVYDIVYSPLETAFLRNAQSAGLRTIGGLGMLIEQARVAFQIWFGHLPEVDENQYKDLLAELHKRQNK